MIVVLGGGPAGHAAARGFRAAGGQGDVVIVTDDDRPPYRRPPLTKEFLRGEATEAELPLEPVAGVETVYGRAVRLDAENRTVSLDDGRKLAYRGCVLATGAEPVRLSVPHDHVMRSARDAIGLRDSVGEGTSAAVIGTGFIGCETAASLAMRGASVTVWGLEDVPQAQRLGTAAGRHIADWLEECGCELRLGAPVQERPDADVVVMAAGVTPRVELARDAGLRLDAGAIAADSALRTTAPDVYAAGDVCAAQHPVAGRPVRVEHWGDALGQGEVVGRRLAGDDEAVWDSVPGFWSTIGTRTLKYAAWGDGFARDSLDGHEDGWSVWYEDSDGECVGVLTHNRDADYERAQELLAG